MNEGQCMKSIWLGVIFFLVYGLFSMKSRAAENSFYADSVFAGNQYCRNASLR
jgi:hypothetical protein